MKRHYSPDQDNLFIIDVGPETAQWKYLSFRIAKLPPGRVLEGNSGSDEIAIVPLHGRARIAFNNNSHELRRDDLFQQLADVVYLPPRTSYTIESLDGFEVAIGGAPATGRLPARIIRKEEIPTGVRGGANAARGVSALLDSDELTERLTVYEIHTPSGNWSSFPPHRHDTRDNSSYHEETYYYRLRPPEGFAIQRLYTRDTDLDVAIPVHDGDLVLIHEGYHPVVKAPGTNAYYLNVRQVIFAEATAGFGFELPVIASVVIGGTNLMGGLGGVAGTVVVTILIGVLLNGLVITNVNPYYQQVIIVLAVGFDNVRITDHDKNWNKWLWPNWSSRVSSNC